MPTYAITDVAVILRPEDDVAIAKKEIAAGTILDDGAARIDVRQTIRPGMIIQSFQVNRVRRCIGSEGVTSPSALTKTPFGGS